MKSKKRYTYTVYFDCGIGEFLWCKESGTGTHLSVGGQLYSAWDYGSIEAEDLICSLGLFEAFCDWADFYMSHDCDMFGANRDIDWKVFNDRAIELATRLKEELGDFADVMYRCPWDCPKEIFPHTPIEIKTGGALIAQSYD